jgi:hypothetical protein
MCVYMCVPIHISCVCIYICVYSASNQILHEQFIYIKETRCHWKRSDSIVPILPHSLFSPVFCPQNTAGHDMISAQISLQMKKLMFK